MFMRMVGVHLRIKINCIHFECINYHDEQMWIIEVVLSTTLGIQLILGFQNSWKRTLISTLAKQSWKGACISSCFLSWNSLDSSLLLV